MGCRRELVSCLQTDAGMQAAMQLLQGSTGEASTMSLLAEMCKTHGGIDSAKALLG